MCVLVTIATPLCVPAEDVRRRIRERTPFRFDKASPATIVRALPCWSVLTGANHPCDCGVWFAGSVDLAEVKDEEVRLARRAARIGRERGWGSARIADWTAQQRALRAHEHERRAADTDAEVRHWLELFAALLSERKLHSFVVLWHEYGGEVASEPVELAGHQIRSSLQLESTLRCGLLPDVAYEFTRPRRRGTWKCARTGC